MSDYTNRSQRPVSGVFADLVQHVTTLFRKEMDLARAELGENVKRAGTAVGLLVGAAILALVALNVLAAALISALAETGLGAAWSAVIVGGVLALIGLFMALKAQSDLRATSLAPTRTTRSVRRDAEAVREHARRSEDPNAPKETANGA